MFKVFRSCVLIFLLTACSVSTLPLTTPTPARTASPVKVLTPTSTTSINSISTPTIDQLLSITPGRILPDIEYICPAERVVPLSSLGLSQRFRVIIEDENNTTGGFLMLGSSNTSPEEVPNTSPDFGYHNEFKGSSLDGRWFLYFKVLNNTFDGTLWISSFDGEQQWQLALIDARYAVGWVSNEEILVAGRPDDRQNYTPLLLINPFTLETVSLPPIPESGIDLAWWQHGEINYLVYYDDYYELPSGRHTKRFVIYNYLTGEAQIAFQWLNDETDYYDDMFKLYYMLEIYETPDDRISMIIVRPYGFDLAPNLDIDTIITENDYQEIMQPVFLPGEEADMRITWISRTNPMIAFDRLHYLQSEPRYTQFYVLDYQNMSIIDYCYDRGLIPETLSASISDRGRTGINSFASPDERYLAWNIYNLDTGDVEGTSIIDLETGYVSYIDDTEVIGWGVIER